MARKTFHCIFLLKSSHWAVRKYKTHGGTRRAGKGNLTLWLVKKNNKVLRWKPDCTKILVPDRRIVLINSCTIRVHIPGNQSRKSSPPAYHMRVRLPLVSRFLHSSLDSISFLNALKPTGRANSEWRRAGFKNFRWWNDWNQRFPPFWTIGWVTWKKPAIIIS